MVLPETLWHYLKIHLALPEISMTFFVCFLQTYLNSSLFVRFSVFFIFSGIFQKVPF